MILHSDPSLTSLSEATPAFQAMARGAESQQHLQQLQKQNQQADTSGISGPTPPSASGTAATPAAANLSSSSPNASPATSGPQYLKLRPLGIADIPAHARLKGAQKNPTSVSSFLRQVFTEAKDSTVEGFARIGSKCDHVREPDAWTWFKVEKLKHQEPGEHETWFARRSWHDEDEAKVEGHVVGFEQLDGVLRKNHSFHELCYTPNVYDSNDVLVWDKGDLLDAETELERDLGIREVEMRITQMYHSMPWPVQNRVFTFLLISGIRCDLPNPNIKSHARPPSESDTPSKESQLITPTAQFMVLQIPVDLSTFPSAIQQARHDHSPDGSHLVYRAPTSGPTGALSKEQQKQAGRKVIEGTYVSVEKVTRMEKVDGKFMTEWTMKTASDARGALPGWMQNLGVPGQIAQDVGWVLGYIVGGHGKDIKKGEKRKSR